MKRIYVILVCLLTSTVSLVAQQTETYSHYIYNHFAINPAVAGTSECTDVKFGTRMQWTGFGDGAPMTNFVSIHKGFGQKKGHSISNVWHGVGMYLVDDRTGMYKRTALYPAYALHMKVGAKTIASVGTYVGIKNQKFGGIRGHSDPALANGASVIIFPDLGLGGLLYSEKAFFGVSLKQILRRDMSGTGGRIGLESKARMQTYITGGFRVNPKGLGFGYTPSVNIKLHPTVPASIETSLMLHYLKDNLNLGFTYRYKDAIVGLIEFQMIKKVSLAYAYDYTVSKLRPGKPHTHEIMLKWDPCWSSNSFGGVHCPVF